MTASTLAFRIAVLLALAGFGVGLYMGISHDHAVAPAHAHLLLLGWLSLFAFGAFYRFNPMLDRGRFAFLQVMFWAISVTVMALGIALITTGGQGRGEPLAGIGSIGVFLGMIAFAIQVFRSGVPVADTAAADPRRQEVLCLGEVDAAR
ncbi:hypothetical protein [Methyloraptor flagellatus]|uniref:Cbb3-type cytochrome c oxidase subunit I n=1 Tax=Methyloraptor flagellatus TaxID=3162530 RepID=A0AAU7X5V0_9HYPH